MTAAKIEELEKRLKEVNENYHRLLKEHTSTENTIRINRKNILGMGDYILELENRRRGTDTDRAGSLTIEKEAMETEIAKLETKIQELEPKLPELRKGYEEQNRLRNALEAELRQERYNLEQERKAAALEQEKERERLKQEGLEKQRLEKQKLQEEAESLRMKQEQERLIRNVLVEAVKGELDEYLEKRAERFLVKDTLSSADKKARDIIVSELKEKLDKFAESGTNEDVVAALSKAVDKFPGIHFQTTLHQITVKILGETPEGDNSAEAEQILNSQKENNPDYVQSMNKLYDKLKAMQSFGDKLSNPEEKKVMTKLATQLTKDVDYFISQHPNNVPDKKSFERFQTKFNARLHSEDVVMSKHESWKSFAINLLLAVATIGVALGIKAIYSKATEGRVTFFAAETEKQKMIKGVENTLDKAASEEKTTAPEIPKSNM